MSDPVVTNVGIVQIKAYKNKKMGQYRIKIICDDRGTVHITRYFCNALESAGFSKRITKKRIACIIGTSPKRIRIIAYKGIYGPGVYDWKLYAADAKAWTVRFMCSIKRFSKPKGV